MIALLCASIVLVLELQHRTDCKADRMDHHNWGAWSTPHDSQRLFFGQWQFPFWFYHTHARTHTHRHVYLAVSNHPQIEKGKKDVRNRTWWGSNPQHFDWKSTAQTTAPYSHSMRLPARTRTRAHMHTHISNSVWLPSGITSETWSLRTLSPLPLNSTTERATSNYNYLEWILMKNNRWPKHLLKLLPLWLEWQDFPKAPGDILKKATPSHPHPRQQPTYINTHSLQMYTSKWSTRLNRRKRNYQRCTSSKSRVSGGSLYENIQKNTGRIEVWQKFCFEILEKIVQLTWLLYSLLHISLVCFLQNMEGWKWKQNYHTSNDLPVLPQ